MYFQCNVTESIVKNLHLQIFMPWYIVCILYQERSSWSYGSWIYNYLGNQCLIIKVVSSNPTHGVVYSIQHYVINFVSDLWQVDGFLWVLWFPPPIKLTATVYLKYCWKWC